MKLWLAGPAALVLFASPAAAQHQQDHGATQEQPAQPDPHAGHTQAPAQPDPHAGHEGHGPQVVLADFAYMPGVLGNYPMEREASGTAWQPDVSPHGGWHARHGEWRVMGHVMLNGVYAWSDGPRGDEKAFVAGMIMGSARRDLGEDGRLNLRIMLSPDPFMGANGYPLLFAAGETADGVTTLVDRQHPHDLFMELSASYSHRFDGWGSAFVYGGLPGEPAFGPPAFMHRLTAMDSPEAPITHHWFDSTHITFGVLTLGWASQDDWRIEVSRFRGREPDEHRYDIETGDLDSTSVRFSWNPTGNWALQASWADVTSPEALHPDEDEERLSVSAIYTARIGEHGWWAATLAYANKEHEDEDFDAWLAEVAYHPSEAWTFFARAEAIETEELGGGVEDVARLSVGAIRDWRVNEHAVIGVGALVQEHFASDALEPSYDGDPAGAMAFVRLRIG